MGRHRPRSRAQHIVRSISLTAIASLTTFGALSVAFAPSASAAESLATSAKPAQPAAQPTAQPTKAQAPLTRPLGLRISDHKTGVTIAGAGYHLCGPAAAAAKAPNAGAFCPSGMADLSGSRSNAAGEVQFGRFPGGEYVVVQAHSPSGYVPEAVGHLFSVPAVLTEAQSKTTFWGLILLNPKAPGLNQDKIKTWENQSRTINVLRNDNPINGSLTLLAVGSPKHGTVTKKSDGTVTYRPATGFVGKDSFTYSARNTAGTTATGGVVRVKVRNIGPTARDVRLTTTVDTAVGFEPLKYATAPAGDHLRLWAITQPTHGQAVVAGNEVLYIPDAGFTGTDTFTYTVTDGQGACDTAKVTVTIPKTEVLGRPPVTAPTLPETGLRDVDSAALIGLGLLGLGIALVAAGSLPWRRQPI